MNTNQGLPLSNLLREIRSELIDVVINGAYKGLFLWGVSIILRIFKQVLCNSFEIIAFDCNSFENFSNDGLKFLIIVYGLFPLNFYLFAKLVYNYNSFLSLKTYDSRLSRKNFYVLANLLLLGFFLIVLVCQKKIFQYENEVPNIFLWLIDWFIIFLVSAFLAYPKKVSMDSLTSNLPCAAFSYFSLSFIYSWCVTEE